MNRERPGLASNDNQPRLREPKPPFGLERKRWNRIRLRLFAAAAVFASAFALWLITRRVEQVEEHRIQGERLASYYAVASEEVGCDTSSSRPTEGIFVGIHQGFPLGPVLVDCRLPQQCQTVSQRDPDLGQPATFRGSVADVNWAEWASPPDILVDSEGSWVGSQRRSWRQEGECHTIERHEVLALDNERLIQSTEILHGSWDCAAEEEPALGCVFRRVRELRAPRR
ncbi:MAG: hypothetical protein ACI9KE_001598 [Polyangiales bacterium]